MESTINIGCSKETVGIARQAILNIMECRADQETIRVALGCLKEVCSIGNVSFSNCNISGRLHPDDPCAQPRLVIAKRCENTQRAMANFSYKTKSQTTGGMPAEGKKSKAVKTSHNS
jgi:hypothetical protein